MKTFLALISIGLLGIGLTACDAGGSSGDVCTQAVAAVANCPGLSTEVDKNPCEGAKLAMSQCILDLPDKCDEAAWMGCVAAAMGQ